MKDDMTEKVINYNGKLAIESFWWNDQNEPKQTQYIYVSDINADDWVDIIGFLVESWSVNTATIYANGRTYYLDTTKWERVSKEQAVPKPRRGKRGGLVFDWYWERGKWNRRWL